MKKKILLLMGVFAFGLLQAQVGINTNNPLGVFHIDAARNNSATPTAAQLQDDVIFTSDGKLGLGMVPSATDSSPLQINGSIMIWYSTIKRGYVLTASNSSGFATWQSPTVSYGLGFRPSASTDPGVNIYPPIGTAYGDYQYTGMYVNIPPQSMVAINVSVKATVPTPLGSNAGMMILLTFSDTNTAPFSQSAYLLSDTRNVVGTIDAGAQEGVIAGTIFAENTTIGYKVLRLIARVDNANNVPSTVPVNIGSGVNAGYNSIVYYKVKKLN